MTTAICLKILKIRRLYQARGKFKANYRDLCFDYSLGYASKLSVFKFNIMGVKSAIEK